jgi:TRAP-type C4-dicarboxylate transport system permease small subunit
METPKRSPYTTIPEAVLKTAAAFCLLGMAVITGADVLSRGAFNAPIFGTEEIVSVLAVLTLAFSMPYAHSQGSHIGVDLLLSKFPRIMRRIIDALTMTISAVLFAVAAWRTVLLGEGYRESGQVSMNLELPLHIVAYALALGFAVFALFLFKDMLKLFLTRKAR